jgi:ribosomal protein S3
MISFYRYDVKLINDAINVIYITLILKQPLFLAQFIAYQLRKTPRNYRFGKIVQFLSQTITSVVKNRKEILGCRIQFKGRIGGRRSRRARKLLFISEGVMPLHSYNSKIEYGEASGLTRFGTVGIKIWLCYNKDFNYSLQKDLLLYFSYNKQKLLK